MKWRVVVIFSTFARCLWGIDKPVDFKLPIPYRELPNIFADSHPTVVTNQPRSYNSSIKSGLKLSLALKFLMVDEEEFTTNDDKMKYS